MVQEGGSDGELLRVTVVLRGGEQDQQCLWKGAKDHWGEYWGVNT